MPGIVLDLYKAPNKFLLSMNSKSQREEPGEGMMMRPYLSFPNLNCH